MNFQVLLNGNNINSYVLSYIRTQSLCEGVGKVKVEAIKQLNVSIGDTLSIYEDGIKKGEYFIKEIDTIVENGSKIIDGQDDSWKLENFFITDNIIVGDLETNLYYITWVLDQVGVDYSIDVNSSEAQFLEKDTSIGMQSAMDLLIELCRYSGWYFWFDADNTCHISKIRVDYDIAGSLTDYNALDLEIREDDKMLRNRGLVYGGANGINGYIVAEEVKITGYEYDEKDIRTVVYSNPNLHHGVDASTIARELVKEFARVTNIKTVSLEGFYNFKINDVVWLDSEYYNGACLITTVEVSVSNSGAITTFVLDQRCPKLIIYFGLQYVYVGTVDRGIWRKPIRLYHVWQSFNEGIDPNDYYINDLKILGDSFACIANKKLYVRGGYNGRWIKISVLVFTDENEEASDPNNVYPTSTSINPSTYYVETIFTDFVKHISWVVVCNTSGTILSVNQIKHFDNSTLRGVSIGHYNFERIISAIKPLNVNTNLFDYPNISNYATDSLYFMNDRGYRVGDKIHFINVGFEGSPVYRNYITVTTYDLETGTASSPRYLYYEYETVQIFEGATHLMRYGNIVSILITMTYYSNPSIKWYKILYVDLNSFGFMISTTQNPVSPNHVFNGHTITTTGSYIDSGYTFRFALKDLVNHSFSAKNDAVFYIEIPYTLPQFKDNVALSIEAMANVKPDEAIYFVRCNGAAGTQKYTYVISVKYDGNDISYWIDNLSYIISDHDYYVYSVAYLEYYQAYFAIIRDSYTNTVYLVNLYTGEYEDITSASWRYFSQKYFSSKVTSIFCYPNYKDGTPVVHGNGEYERFVYVIEDDKYFFACMETFPNINLLYIDDSSEYTVYNRQGGSFGHSIHYKADYGIIYGTSDTNNPAYIIFPSDIENVFDMDGGGYIVARLDEISGKYKTIGYTTGPTCLEINSVSPILTYPLPTNSYVMSGIYPSGTLFSGYIGNLGIVSDLRYSFTGEYGSLFPVISGQVLEQISGYPLDTRGFYQYNVSGTTLYVETPISLFPAGEIAVSVLNFDFETSLESEVPSGQVTRIETTSMLNYPYLFISVSGDRTRFFQRDGSDTILGTFVDRTNNLPDSFITVIRAEEM